MPTYRPWKIALISAAILLLELTFIRQVPAEVRAISYFTNLLLMAAFFGLGLGCILQRQRTLSWLLPLGLVLVAGLIYVGRGIVIYEESAAVQYWFQYQSVPATAIKLPLFPAAVAAFIFGALPFVALGQLLARAMDQHPRLIAYGWDIAGSLAGTLLFTLCSYLNVPPWIWPPILMLVWAIVFLRRWPWRVIWLVAGISFLGFADTAYEWRWSPYYLVQYEEDETGLRMWSNSNFLQHGIDFTNEHPAYQQAARSMLVKWGKLYEIYRAHHAGRSPERVLILGAGTGNDVYVARQYGAKEIVAVEIDPVILDVGRTRNRTRPYDLPGVVTVVDDARHFLRTHEGKFDVIAFATIDSVVLLTGHSNLRLENYVYTKESLEDTRRLLADGGMVGIYYSVHRPWLRNRIYATARAAFGDAVQFHAWQDMRLFNTLVVGAKEVEGFHDPPNVQASLSEGTACTDDWPYLYVRERTIAPVYLQLFGVILLLIGAAFLLLRRIYPVTGLHANFLFLGLGFTLMESSAIVRLSLIFGSTWTVNAVVFSSVLLTIFIANYLVLKGKAPALRTAWFGLLAWILVNYLFPMSRLLEMDAALRVFSCGLLIGLPVFFAAICFSQLFKHQRVTGYPLGINLIGAMAGGLIEYASMAVGMRSVWLIIALIYGLAWLSTGVIGTRDRVSPL
jgi:SAM-dependent methyltransferase